MADVRKGEVTMKGNPVDLAGPKLKAGDKAPDFDVRQRGARHGHAQGYRRQGPALQRRPVARHPGLHRSRRRSSPRTSTSLGDKVAAYTISLDLPFAMKRYCADNRSRT